MNIIVTTTVDLNVLQNASKCTISEEKIQKFNGEGAVPTGEGVSPSQDPTPVSASIPRTPSKPHFWLRAWNEKQFRVR